MVIEPGKRSETVDQAVQTIERRVNELGVAEPVVARYGDDDRILVQLPGVVGRGAGEAGHQGDGAAAADAGRERAVSEPRGGAADLWKPASSAPRGPARAAPGGQSGTAAFYVVQERLPRCRHQDLRDARASVDEFNRPAVAFTLTPDAGRRFGAFTERHINRLLATVLDDRVDSVATINSRIDESGQIVGVSRDEMLDQVVTLKSGALPADMEYVADHMVGASLGRDAIRSGVSPPQAVSPSSGCSCSPTTAAAASTRWSRSR